MLKDKMGNIAGQKRLIRFCIVGGVNTLIDFGVFFGLHYGLGVWVMVAHVTGAVLAILNSYLLNKYWTFGDTSPHSRSQITKFLSVSLAGLALSSLTIFLCKMSMDPLPAKVIAVFVSLVWNYLGNRFLVFIQGETRR
ncbi:MAG: teichoic acid glycosylation protein [Micavibrio sp.]|nr:teichoic acid glycosylation protein [Micavibrio sp.]